MAVEQIRQRMGDNRLVSIVLPVYNGARFLRESIDSCLNQTYSNWELIVVDDGSTDNSVAIVQAYDDQRIKLIRHEVNRKLPAALNTGFARAKGYYLTWTSHDNYYLPTAIAEMTDFLEENPSIDFVFCDEYDMDEEGRIGGVFQLGRIEYLWKTNCVGGAFLYTRRVHDKIGPYNERAFLAEDYDYWLRTSVWFKMAHLTKPLYCYRRHPASLSSQFGSVEASLLIRRKIFGKNPWKNRRLLHDIHLSGAYYLYEVRKNRWGSLQAILWAIAFEPKSLLNRRVQVLLTSLCFGRSATRALLHVKQKIKYILGFFALLPVYL